MHSVTRRNRESAYACAWLAALSALLLSVSCGSQGGDDSAYLFPPRAKQGELVYMLIGTNAMVLNLDGGFEEGSLSPDLVPDGIPRPMYSLTRDNVVIGFYQDDGATLVAQVTPTAVFPISFEPGAQMAAALSADPTVTVAAFTVPASVTAGEYQVHPLDNPYAMGTLTVEPGTGTARLPDLVSLGNLERKPTLRLLMQREGQGWILTGPPAINTNWEIGAIEINLVWTTVAPDTAAFTIDRVVPRGDAVDAVGIVQDDLRFISILDTVWAFQTIHIIDPNGFRLPGVHGVPDGQNIGTGPFADLHVTLADGVSALAGLTVGPWWVKLWDVDGNLLLEAAGGTGTTQPWVKVLTIDVPASS